MSPSGKLLPLLVGALLALPTLEPAPLHAQNTSTGGIVVEDLPATGEGTPPPVGAAEAEAQKEYANGNLGRALELYLQLAAADPDPAQRARLGITAAWLSFQLGDREAAAAELRRVLYDRPDARFDPSLFNPDFQALYQDSLKEAVARRARTAAEKTGLAVDAIHAGRYDQARKLLDEALVLQPDDPGIRYDLALVDLRQGRSDDALAGFQRVLTEAHLRPDAVSADLHSQALDNVAVLFYARGDYESARSALQESLALDPKDAYALFNLGLTLQKLGDADGGWNALREARSLDRHDVDIARALALADADRGQWVDAVALLLEATKSRPEDPELWLQLARAQRGLGNADGALESLATTQRLDPGNRLGFAATAARTEAEIRIARKDPGGAAAAAGRAVEMDASNVDGWMLLGVARLDAGDAAGAHEALAHARQIAPSRADVAHDLGSACLAEHDYACAETAFRSAVELNPANADAKSLLDRLVARREAAEAAAAAANQHGRSRRPPPGIDAALTSVDYAPLGIRGLRVDAVAAGGVSERAGLRVGDLVLRVDGKPATTAEQLVSRVRSRRAGVLLDVLRSGKPVQVRLRLD
jgi:tetratricopeptide (TPR) repeat protein